MLYFSFYTVCIGIDLGMDYNEITVWMENRVDPDQLASSEASLSGSALFLKEDMI